MRPRRTPHHPAQNATAMPSWPSVAMRPTPPPSNPSRRKGPQPGKARIGTRAMSGPLALEPHPHANQSCDREARRRIELRGNHHHPYMLVNASVSPSQRNHIAPGNKGERIPSIHIARVYEVSLGASRQREALRTGLPSRREFLRTQDTWTSCHEAASVTRCHALHAFATCVATPARSGGPSMAGVWHSRRLQDCRRIEIASGARSSEVVARQ